MPFLAAVPGIAGALGATIPAGLSTALTVLPAAFGVASGIAKGDPVSAITSLLPAVGPIASGVGSAASGAMSAANAGASLGNTANVLNGIGSAANLGLATGTPPPAPPVLGANAGSFLGQTSPASLVPQGKSGSMLGKMTQVIGGANAAANGVMSLLAAFKRHTSPINLNPINPGLSPMGGAQSAGLPGIPQIPSEGAAGTPQGQFQPIAPDLKLLQLLGAYQG